MNPAIYTSARINELLDKFNNIWNQKTKNSSSFITLSEIEALLDSLNINTNKLYLEMINDYIKNIDEKEFINKKIEFKKEGIHLRNSKKKI